MSTCQIGQMDTRTHKYATIMCLVLVPLASDKYSQVLSLKQVQILIIREYSRVFVPFTI
jgi:hypothetical protein